MYETVFGSVNMCYCIEVTVNSLIHLLSANGQKTEIPVRTLDKILLWSPLAGLMRNDLTTDCLLSTSYETGQPRPGCLQARRLFRVLCTRKICEIKTYARHRLRPGRRLTQKRSDENVLSEETNYLHKSKGNSTDSWEPRVVFIRSWINPVTSTESLVSLTNATW